MRELCSVTIAELKYLYAMVHKIRYSPLADIVKFFKDIRTLAGPIECTSLVTWVATNLGCSEIAHVYYVTEPPEK
jgi:hypothetical protein